MNKTKDDTVQKLAELKAKEKDLLRQMRAPRHICEDVTSERLAELMEQNNEEMVSCSTDARGACKTLFGKYRSGNAGDEDPYIKGFSGDRLSQDRIGRSGACLINPILTVAWCVQLDHFDNAYANPTLRNSGFLPRCLPCRLDGNSSAPKYESDPAVSEALRDYTEIIHALFNEYHLSQGPPRFVKVSPEAHEALTEFDRKVRTELPAAAPAERIFWSRWGELAYRIALIFHCGAHGAAAHSIPLEKSTAKNAIDVMGWFAIQQLDLLGKVQENSDNDKLAIALAFVNRSGHGGVSARDLYRYKQTIFKDDADARDTLDRLESERAIDTRTVGKSCRFFRRALPGEKVVGVSYN